MDDLEVPLFLETPICFMDVRNFIKLGSWWGAKWLNDHVFPDRPIDQEARLLEINGDRFWEVSYDKSTDFCACFIRISAGYWYYFVALPNVDAVVQLFAFYWLLLYRRWGKLFNCLVVFVRLDFLCCYCLVNGCRFLEILATTRKCIVTHIRVHRRTL